MDKNYDYIAAGFDPFLQRSIDGEGALTLNDLGGKGAIAQTRQVNFDQNQISGQLGDKLQIGSITLDGQTGRISVFDENGNEVVRIGEL